MSAPPSALVIGSGFGGLALAIRLQSAGIATTVIEARDRPGGRAYVWKRDGYTFDAGPTVITDPACLEELWALSGSNMADDVTLMPVNPFYQLLWGDGTKLAYSNEEAALKAEIARLCTFESDTRKTELIKSCKVGSTWYAAARVTSIDGSPVEDATYVTYSFLHGNLLHLGSNMIFLWVFGDNVEDSMGHVRFLAFNHSYVEAAALAQAVVNPSSTVPMVGASGAI